MRRLLEIITVIGLIALGGSVAFANDGLGMIFPPSIATETAPMGVLGAGLIAAGVMLLSKRRRT